jgi:translation initiation factor 2 subunit 2
MRSRAAPRAADDEEETPVAPVRAARRQVAAEDGDAAPPVRRAPPQAEAHDDPNADGSATAVRRRAAPAATDTAAALAAESAASTSATISSLLPQNTSVVDYDQLTYDQFLAQLRRSTKDECLAQAAARVKSSTETATADATRALESFPDLSGGYSYSMLLDRVYEELHLKNPHLSGGEAARAQLPQPSIEKHGAKKTAVANFQAICDAMHRTLEEVKDYIDKELSTQSALDANNCLLLKLQNVKGQQFENVVLKYVGEFVKCNSCRSIDTVLVKDADRRMLLLRCNNCKAERNVKSSSQGYKAETGKRSKARQAAL